MPTGSLSAVRPTGAAVEGKPASVANEVQNMRSR
jgi:hypothetical protein